MISSRLLEMRQRVRDREQRKWRQQRTPSLIPECEAEGLSWTRRAARLTRRMCEAEVPVIEPDQRIARVDHRALIDEHLGHAARDLGADDRLARGLKIADEIDGFAEHLLADLSDLDGRRWHARALSPDHGGKGRQRNWQGGPNDGAGSLCHVSRTSSWREERGS